MRRLAFNTFLLAAFVQPIVASAEGVSLFNFEVNGLKNSNALINEVNVFNFETGAWDKNPNQMNTIDFAKVNASKNSIELLLTGAAIHTTKENLEIKGHVGAREDYQQMADGSWVLAMDKAWWDFSLRLSLKDGDSDKDSSDSIHVENIMFHHLDGDDGRFIGPDKYSIKSEGKGRESVDKHGFDASSDGSKSVDHGDGCDCVTLSILKGFGATGKTFWNAEEFDFSGWFLKVRVEHHPAAAVPAAPEPASLLMGLTGVAVVVGARAWTRRGQKRLG